MMRTGGDGVEEGFIALTLKRQLTAIKKGTVLKFDSNAMIGSMRLWQNMILYKTKTLY